MAFKSIPPDIAAYGGGNLTATASAVPAAASGGLGSIFGGLAKGIGGILNPIGSILGGLMGPEEPSTTISGTQGNASFGGINVGSKVVGSGSASTVQPPDTNAQAQTYQAISATGSAAKTSGWLPLAGLAAAGLIVFWLISKKRKD